MIYAATRRRALAPADAPRPSSSARTVVLGAATLLLVVAGRRPAPARVLGAPATLSLIRPRCWCCSSPAPCKLLFEAAALRHLRARRAHRRQARGHPDGRRAASGLTRLRFACRAAGGWWCCRCVHAGLGAGPRGPAGARAMLRAARWSASWSSATCSSRAAPPSRMPGALGDEARPGDLVARARERCWPAAGRSPASCCCEPGGFGLGKVPARLKPDATTTHGLRLLLDRLRPGRPPARTARRST